MKTVRYLDPVTRKVVTMPACELAPGLVRLKMDGIPGDVWTELDPRNFEEGKIRHPPLDDKTRDLVGVIHSAFSEHDKRTVQEWEDGFRADDEPMPEICAFLHAAMVYREFAEREPSADRRADMHRCVMQCLLTSDRDVVRHVFTPKVLSRGEVQHIIDRFFDTTESSFPRDDSGDA